MTQEKLKQFLDACFDAKRLIEKLPDLPDGMKPRQVHVLDAVNEIQKKPSTSELLDWIQALMISGVNIKNLKEEMPFIGVLLKKNQDIDVMNEIKEKGYSLKRW